MRPTCSRRMHPRMVEPHARHRCRCYWKFLGTFVRESDRRVVVVDAVLATETMLLHAVVVVAFAWPTRIHPLRTEDCHQSWDAWVECQWRRQPIVLRADIAVHEDAAVAVVEDDTTKSPT